MNQPFSFCIITDNSLEACQRISMIITTIRNLQIPEYEILIIGGEGSKFQGNLSDVKKIDFDETVKRAWITKKKNDVVKLCKYENVVMFHDYFVFHPNWYQHYNKFLTANEYDICCNPILMQNGIRDYTDWINWDAPGLNKQTALPYDCLDYTKNQYISGGYFVIRKSFLIDNPFDEDLVAGDEEDVEWSLRVREKAKILFNSGAYVAHNKWHRNLTINLWDKLL